MNSQRGMDCNELRDKIFLIKFTDPNTTQFVDLVHEAGYVLKKHYQIQEISMFLKFQMLEFLNKDQMCVVDPEDIFIYITNYNNTNVDIQTDPDHLLKSITDCKTSKYIMVFAKLESNDVHANTIIIDTLSTPMKAWRIEPNYTDEWMRVRNKIFKRRTHNLKENIIEQVTPPEQNALIQGYSDHVNEALRKYLEQIGIMYFNEFPETCGIQHGGLCAYVTVVQFYEGKKISLPILKDYIVRYFIWEYKRLCHRGIKFNNVMNTIENIIKPHSFKVKGNKLTLLKSEFQIINGKMIFEKEYNFLL